MDALDANTPGKRLKWLRETKTSYATATEAAKAFGWKVSTYLGHENGDRRPSIQAAKKYAAAYRAPWVWIMDGGSLLPPGDQEAPPAAFMSYRSRDPKALIELLMNGLYDPGDMPAGSPEEKAVFILLRYLRKKGA